MSELLLWTQGALKGALEFMMAMPLWMALVLVSAPSLVAALTRDIIILLSTVVLSISGILLGALYGTTAALPLILVTLCATVLLAFLAFQQQRYAAALSEIHVRISHIDGQISDFLNNAHERFSILDQESEDARVAFREARSSFERMRKAYLRMQRSLNDKQASVPRSKSVISPFPSTASVSAIRSDLEKSDEPASDPASPRLPLAVKISADSE
ncbi:hypothetical protein [Microvirga arsenatis]|uniref:Uncharacterized protein n=1 Tax=Microvirga arsenatis TaxID=2692265 RepID=A0ABW9YS51_9HYPH|nr:hypothetical protein [Microvirga arsenatis]NBJ10059.1 hypothetical protein [Microvirga arsenatis]NBJ23127.1 hypothetical protein [Microvirga arsenatis]